MSSKDDRSTVDKLIGRYLAGATTSLDEKTALIEGLSANLMIVTDLIKQVRDEAKRLGVSPNNIMLADGTAKIAPLIQTSSIILAAMVQLRDQR